MWATANRFQAGHRLRVDVSSADFPRYDRNANRGGEPGPPVPARQEIFRDARHPSHLLLPVVAGHQPSRDVRRDRLGPRRRDRPVEYAVNGRHRPVECVVNGRRRPGAAH
jgi:hypothetical protein